MHYYPFFFQVLVCADGAPSKLATQLGLVTKPPDSTCSRAFVEGGTHCFKADGVVFYNKSMLPGKAVDLYAGFKVKLFSARLSVTPDPGNSVLQ
jgi:hypothetical protein